MTVPAPFKSAVEEIEDIVLNRESTKQASAVSYLGEDPEPLAASDPVYVRPVVTNPMDPVDEQIVVLEFSDGSLAPEATMPYTPTNPDDPVSPALESQSTGARPGEVEDVHAFPDDPSLEPDYDTPAPAPAPEPSP